MSLLWPSSTSLSSQFQFFCLLTRSLRFFRWMKVGAGCRVFEPLENVQKCNRIQILNIYDYYHRSWNILHNFIVFRFWEKCVCSTKQRPIDLVTMFAFGNVTVYDSRHKSFGRLAIVFVCISFTLCLSFVSTKIPEVYQWCLHFQCNAMPSFPN